MGMATSTVQNQDQHLQKYTSADIENNLKRLFKNNVNNNFSEASQTIGFREGDMPLVGGNNLEIKFKSSKNRHLQHNIDHFLSKIQTGGQKEEIYEQSEFEKIKEYLEKEMQDSQKQEGGNNDNISYESISSISGFNEFADTLQNGGKKHISLATILQSGQLGGDRTDNLEDLEDNNDSDSSSDNEDKLSSTSINDDDMQTANLSPTSGNEGSDELNIIPFYSTSESSHAKPYTKNRLNK